MKLKILGMYGPFPPEGGRTSGYLITHGDTTVVFEMGAGVFSALSGAVDPARVSAVVLSHYHFDHVCDMGVYNYYLEALSRSCTRKECRLILPDFPCDKERELASLKYFLPEKVSAGDSLEVGDITFTFFKAKHPVPTLGFAACADGEKFVYSADGDISDEFLAAAKGADMLLMDGGMAEDAYLSGTSPHASASACAALADRLKIKTLITHINPFTGTEAVKKITSASAYARTAEEGKEYPVR